LRAFARVVHRDSALHLVMAGPDQSNWIPHLQQLARKLGIAERVTWTGMLSGDLKWGAYSAADAFVLPSHQENFGIVVAEALACSLPVLISDKVNIWREVAMSGAGLVAKDTEAGTASLLEDWLAYDSESRRLMRERALRCFAEKFEIHQAARSLIEAISERLPTRPATAPKPTRGRSAVQA
jgi:glycosyltransferase involved in cell wall biosynthesis